MVEYVKETRIQRRRRGDAFMHPRRVGRAKLILTRSSRAKLILTRSSPHLRLSASILEPQGISVTWASSKIMGEQECRLSVEPLASQASNHVVKECHRHASPSFTRTGKSRRRQRCLKTLCKSVFSRSKPRALPKTRMLFCEEIRHGRPGTTLYRLL